MMKRRIEIWTPEEYHYPLAYSFIPNIVALAHEDSEVRPCVIVAPGGSYRFLSPTEGEIIAERFYSWGYNAFVLSYTTDLTMTQPLMRQPMYDISRAIRLIRSKADELHIDPDRLAICGFSAGGHLCASICVHYMDVQDPDPDLQSYSNRPDAAILSYPVITSGVYTHKDSMRALLGDSPSEEDLEYAANERNVSSKTPPCFLWHTLTDESVPVKNSLLFTEACKQKGVPYALHLFSDGPHGLSTADDIWVEESWKADYVLEQTYAILEQIEHGELRNIRSRPYLEDFLKHGRNMARGIFLASAAPNREVAVWPQIAHGWLQKQFQKE